MMKKGLVLAVALGVVMSLAGSAAAQQRAAAGPAAGPGEGAVGISVGMGNSVYGNTGVKQLSGRYFIDRDLAVTAGFGFQMSSGDFDADYFSIQIGARKYLATKDLAPFIGGALTYEKIDFNAPGFDDIDIDAIDIALLFGAEYFFSRQFGVEGSVGLGFGTVEDNQNRDYTYIGTRTVGVSANFYF